MTFALHLFGHELFRFTFGPIEEEESGFVDNTGGDFAIPFGFANHSTNDDEEGDDE